VHLQVFILEDANALPGAEFMDDQWVTNPGFGDLKLQFNDFSNALGSEELELRGTVQQAKGRKQPDEPVQMIAVKMGDADHADPGELHLVLAQLALCSFPTVDQYAAVVYL
jgi:hypothetical protein